MMIVPTPQSIKDDYARDVFAEIFSGYKYASDMEAVMWAVYRYRGIGNVDVDYWVQCMRGRAEILSYMYDLKFKAISELKSEIDTHGIDYSSSSLRSKSTAKDDSSSSLRSKSTANDVSSSSLESKNTAKHYDPPSGSSELKSYVSEGNTTDIKQSERSVQESETDFEQSGQSGAQTETDFEQSAQSGLQTKTVKDWADGIPDIWREYAAEFRDLFYWGL